jgi:cell fate regulator YaaT (PSP1 superfamily)
MKISKVRLDRTSGVFEMEVPDEIHINDYVVCDLEKGACLGVVTSEPEEGQIEGLKKASRKATQEEVSQYFSLRENEKRALTFCRQKVRDMGLPMKLLFAEYLFGGAKLLFYFVSESRVDFRDLVKELAKEFKIRIELRQVGVRDEAKIVGGLGNCGNVCCCKKFLNNFSIVSIKMVKEQSLALNPAKISGICGRLMCCLSYEFDMYMDFKKGFPKLGKRIKLPQGEGKVVKHNALASSITVELEDGKEITLSAKDLVQAMKKAEKEG